MFEIDLTRYRIIDISYTVVPGSNPDRPFDVRKSLLSDRTFKHDILKTHTHVGSHIEFGSHFYEEGMTSEEYALSHFHGRGVVVTVDLGEEAPLIGGSYIDKETQGGIREGDIVIFRNVREPDDPSQYYEPEDKRFFSRESAEYLRERKVKIVVLGKNISTGRDVEAKREFHDILMGSGVLLLEFVDNLQDIGKREVYVMALPFNVTGLDSSWCRPIVIEER